LAVHSVINAGFGLCEPEVTAL